jgi:hypothetical protein
MSDVTPQRHGIRFGGESARREFGYRKNLEERLAYAREKYWEIIADNLKQAGWSWGCVSAVDSNGRTIWIADAHRGDGKRFVVRADEKLTAFYGTGSGDPHAKGQI